MARKPTANQIAFKKEIQRARRLLNRAKKRGYFFPNDILPDQPRRITQKRLTAIRTALTPANIYANAKYVIPDTGEVVSGTEGRTYERRRAALKGIRRKSALTLPKEYTYKITIDNFRFMLAQFSNSVGYSLLNTWLNNVIMNFGIESAVQIINYAVENNIIAIDGTLYDEQVVQSSINELNRVLSSDMKIPTEIMEQVFDGLDELSDNEIMREEFQAQ